MGETVLGQVYVCSLYICIYTIIYVWVRLESEGEGCWKIKMGG